MSAWYPSITRRELRALAGITAFGALLAGTYGALRDQISYTISPEYFTKFKFPQFAWADLGWPNRAFAAEVGFLASWWAGLIAGWLLGRLGLAELWLARDYRRAAFAVAILVLIAALSGALAATAGAVVAYGTGVAEFAGWRAHVDDLKGFVVVAFLHWGSYAGAILGTAAALLYVRRVRLTRARRAENVAIPSEPLSPRSAGESGWG
jgi:hypothetical protein